MRPDRCTLLFAALTACGARASQPAPVPEVDAFRAELADPARYPLRTGLKVDGERLKSAVQSFARTNHDLLDRHFRATFEDLPKGELPAAPAYGLVAEIPPDSLRELADATLFIYVLDPAAPRMARTAINFVIPHLVRELGMSVGDITPWVSFLAAAKPETRVCERGASRVTLCLDYGGLDVLVVTLTASEPGWVLGGFSWHQRGRVTTAH